MPVELAISNDVKTDAALAAAAVDDIRSRVRQNQDSVSRPTIEPNPALLTAETTSSEAHVRPRRRGTGSTSARPSPVDRVTEPRLHLADGAEPTRRRREGAL